MSLDSLPNELLLSLAGFLPIESDLNSLARTSRHLYNILNSYLYNHNVRFSDASALPWTIKHGRKDTISGLLEAGPSKDLLIKQFDKALLWAATACHEEFAHLFLSEGANVNFDNTDVLPAASFEATEHMYKTLLHDSDNVVAQGNLYLNALQAASYGGHEQIVNTLLDKGAGVNAQGGLYGNALQAASVGSHEQVMKTLVKRGAERNERPQVLSNRDR